LPFAPIFDRWIARLNSEVFVMAIPQAGGARSTSFSSSSSIASDLQAFDHEIVQFDDQIEHDRVQTDEHRFAIWLFLGGYTVNEISKVGPIIPLDRNALSFCLAGIEYLI
jgi:hypothetical protein